MISFLDKQKRDYARKISKLFEERHNTAESFNQEELQLVSFLVLEKKPD